jgi:hypothetical protein
MFNYKPYRYNKGENPALDAQFASATVYEKIHVGETALFWKSGLRWYWVPLEKARRIFRRVEPVHGRLCCGGQSFIIEWLVLELSDGEELVLHIGDDVVGTKVRQQAEALLERLKLAHPQIQFGKA